MDACRNERWQHNKGKAQLKSNLHMEEGWVRAVASEQLLYQQMTVAISNFILPYSSAYAITRYYGHLLYGSLVPDVIGQDARRSPVIHRSELSLKSEAKKLNKSYKTFASSCPTV